MKAKRLIDANALFNDLADYWGIPKDWDGQIEQTCEDALSAIENAPEVDAVEVVHGRWEESPTLYGVVRCSVCHDCYIYAEWVTENRWNYCPNCGAKMDGDRDG